MIKKKRLTIKFKAGQHRDRVTCFLHVNANGSSSFVITSANRQAISYEGRVETIKKSN